jgi:hypothetical protein
MVFGGLKVASPALFAQLAGGRMIELVAAK